MCNTLYKPPLTVGAEPPIEQIVAQGVHVASIHHWLDLEVTVGSDIQVTCKSKNHAALRGCSGVVHHSVPEFMQWDTYTVQRVRWWLSSRVHRVRQTDQSHDFILQSLKELQLFGYPVKKLFRLLSGFRQFPFVRQALRQC